MNIDESPLDFEVQRVFNSGFKPSFAGYTGHFKYGEKTVEVIRITDIDISSDFEMSFGPVIMIRVIILLGDYTTDVFPNQENLEFILKTENLKPTSKNVPIFPVRYFINPELELSIVLVMKVRLML